MKIMAYVQKGLSGIIWIESEISSYSQLLGDLFNFLVILHRLLVPNKAS
jgi:hypothetical protein